MKCGSWITILFLISLLSTAIYPQTITDALRLGNTGIGSSARALGMGNSYIGLSDDASAGFFNPAGFGLLKKLEFSGGLDYSNFSNDAVLNSNGSPIGQSNNNSTSSTRLDRVSFAFPFPTLRGSLVFGLSYQNTKDLNGALSFNGYNKNSSFIQFLTLNGNSLPYQLGLSSHLKDAQGNIRKDTTILNGNLNQSGSILNSGGINNWTFSGAIEIYKNLFVGLNMNFISGTFESNNDYYEDDVNHVYNGVLADTSDPNTLNFKTFYLNRLTHWDLSGWDAKFGILYQFNRYSRFGLTVQFPKTYTIKESFTVNGSGQFQNYTYNLNSADFSDKVQYDIITPFEIGAGFSFNIKGLILSAQGTLIDYSQLKFENPDGIDAVTVADLNKSIQNDLTAVVNYNFGAEYTIPNAGLRVRAGYFVQPSAYKGDPVSFDKKYFTAGIGFLADEAIGFDLAFAHGWYSDLGDNYGSNLSRTTQDIKENHFILTGTYRF
ncbi:MAG: hypothetical protein P4L35_16635 [Ignavibacteriaceae bacterium]|nr:hypothetical protein [Ignavibacteriaceae bacterium]